MKLENIKANFLGDSITEGYGTTEPSKVVHQIIKEKFLPLKNVGEVRSIGLINAIELVSDKTTKESLDYKKRTGYLD